MLTRVGGKIFIKNTMTGEAMEIDPDVFEKAINLLWEEHF